MSSTDLTLRSLSLGAPDSTTGWYAPTYSESTIQGVIRERGSTIADSPIGLHAIHDFNLFTNSPVAEGDQIKDAFNDYYTIVSVKKIPYLDSIYCFHGELKYDGTHADRPSTSGTWPSVGDPSYRIKSWLTTYLTAANMKKDNNADNATTLVAMDWPDYSLTRVFIGKSVDLIFSIGRSRSTPAHVGYDKIITHYNEQVQVNCCAIDKSGITARRLVWAGEAEIRRIAGTAAGAIGTGSVRTYASGAEKPVSLGARTMWDLPVMIDWTRDAT